MARDKVQRELNLKPVSKYFGPKDIKTTKDIVLLHEELEAIHLMDFQGLYQEDAAKTMNVSRATFSRILKSARKKISICLITGCNLKVHETKNEFHVAVCSSSNKELENISTNQPYIFIFFIKDYKLQSTMCVNNPCQSEERSDELDELVQVLHEYTANYFITNNIDESVKKLLISKGIYPIIQDSTSIDTIVEIFK